MQMCRHPGCPAFVRSGYCEAHQSRRRYCAEPGCSVILEDGSAWCRDHHPKRKHDLIRGTGTARGYDATWERCRDAFMAQNPLCFRCEQAGKVVPAVLVHHIRSLREGGARLDHANLMPLCRRCHNQIHTKGGR